MNAAGDRVAIGAIGNDDGGDMRDTCVFISIPLGLEPASVILMELKRMNNLAHLFP